MTTNKDFGLENLLALNGDRYFVDDKGELEVIFKVALVAVTPEMPHGLKYSLMLLNARNERVICFDNAHSVRQGSGPGKKRLIQFDHKHIRNRVTPYDFKDAATLLQDFWKAVDTLL